MTHTSRQSLHSSTPEKNPSTIEGDAHYEKQGYLQHTGVLTPAQYALLNHHFTQGPSIKPAVWWKGRAVTNRLLYDIASSEPLLVLLRPLLGNNIILYGASTVERRPGESHPWHVDIESSAPGEHFATVWIGLRNTSRESGLKMVAGSHHFPQCIQQIQHSKGYSRGEADDETVLEWARECDPSATIVQPEIADGDALIFNGRMWHGSLNSHSCDTRLALLLQYASTDSPVYLPPKKSFEWPFDIDTVNRPPVLVVSGDGNNGNNKQVDPPPTSPPEAKELKTQIQSIDLPLTENPKRGWQQYHFFKGLTNVHDAISCHASVLSPGRMPHAPHSHIEEEILIVLDGDAELLIGNSSDVSQARVHTASAGTMAYYPAYQHHSLRNIGDQPLTYLMFRWRGAPVAENQALETTIIDVLSQHTRGKNRFRISVLFEGHTHWLGKLHAHYSEVDHGGGYDVHCDPYDIAIIVLSGSIETHDTQINTNGIVYFAANEPHGLRGVGTETARYLVIEFHGLRGGPGGRTRIYGTVPYQKNKLYARIAHPLRQIPGLPRLIPRRIKTLAKKLLR